MNQRPATPRFQSIAVEATIATESARITDAKLRALFANCYPNTLDTTVFHRDDEQGRPDTFVITGDIHALWLRDSTAQVWPYLPLAADDAALARMIAGLVRRQTHCILIDPYANAFNDGPGDSEWKTDHTEMKPDLHERKWELDSLCYAIRLAHGYWQATRDSDVFDADVFDQDWLAAMELAVATMIAQQRKTGPGPYRFARTTHWQSDTLPCNGWGNPLKPVGLIASMFRPSDDACVFGFLVPSNHFAVVSLRQLADLLDQHYPGHQLASRSRELADEVDAALQAHAIVTHPEYGRIWAYEVDGCGNALLMDDANVPSLLSLPYLGVCLENEEVYANTRRFVLSGSNPWHFRSSDGRISGIGSPHTLVPRIWPMSIILRALTSRDAGEIRECLTMLVNSDGGSGLMHESFMPDDPSDFTRAWFAWANTLFGELVLKVVQEQPALLSEHYAREGV
ncbi:glycoside hydrolase family 125 protein [Chitinilyticum aquatile]|uniref:glycoside hydrolase family 125 protein n=1 Tax=Chitinilyticum aquatile TaxID=362520 RepID=UPI000419E4CE|nr:glycoside hydrolase family 125 protein [Chitinilyticum aquatile]